MKRPYFRYLQAPASSTSGAPSAPRFPKIRPFFSYLRQLRQHYIESSASPKPLKALARWFLDSLFTMSQRLNPLRLFQVARTAGSQQGSPAFRMTFATAQRSSTSQISQKAGTGFRAASRQSSGLASIPRLRMFGQRPRRPFSTSRRFRSSQEGSKPDAEPQTIGARLKKLTREYGWVTVAVYLGLSVLDFPFCFLLVKVAGPDKIGKIRTSTSFLAIIA